MRIVPRLLALGTLTALGFSLTPAVDGRPVVGIGIGIGVPYPYYRPWGYYGPYGYYGYPYYYPPPPVVVQQPPVVVQQPAPPVMQPVPQQPPAQAPAPSYRPPAPSDVPITNIEPVSIDQDLQALSSPDAGVRQNSVMNLGRGGNSRAIDPLSATLAGDASASVRDAAARALGLIADPRSLPALIRAAQADNDRDVRHSAQFAVEIIRSRMQQR